MSPAPAPAWPSSESLTGPPADTLVIYGDAYGRALALALDDAIRIRWPADPPRSVWGWRAPAPVAKAELALLMDLRRRAIERAWPDRPDSARIGL